MASFFDVQPGDILRIGPGTRITVQHKSGNRARLRIESDEPIGFVRHNRKNGNGELPHAREAPPRSTTGAGLLFKRPKM